MNLSASSALKRGSSKRGLQYSRQRIDARDSSRNSSKVSMQSEKESTSKELISYQAVSLSEDFSSFDDLAVFARLLSDKEMGAQVELPKLPPLVEKKHLKQEDVAKEEKQSDGSNEQQDKERTNDVESTDMDTLETSLNPMTDDHLTKHDGTDFAADAEVPPGKGTMDSTVKTTEPDLPDLEENLRPSETAIGNDYDSSANNVLGVIFQ